MIYFIQAGTDGPVKIGYSEYPEKRLKDLQTSHYSELHLIGVMAGDILLEKQLQKEFEFYRINNEWFKFSNKINNFIKDHCQSSTINSLFLLPNGDIRILFAKPLIPNSNILLLIGSFNLRVLGDKKPEIIKGIEGKKQIIKKFISAVGLDQNIKNEYLALMDS
jgi:hypothetical protein